MVDHDIHKVGDMLKKCLQRGFCIFKEFWLGGSERAAIAVIAEIRQFLDVLLLANKYHYLILTFMPTDMLRAVAPTSLHASTQYTIQIMQTPNHGVDSTNRTPAGLGHTSSHLPLHQAL